MGSLLLSLAVKGTVVLAIGASATALFRRSSASLRHGIWAATFVALLAVPMLGVLGPSWRVAVLPSEASALAQAPLALSPTPSAKPSADGPGGLSSPVPTASRSAERVAMRLGGLWALGMLAVSLFWLRGFVLGRRLVRASRVVDDRSWSARLRIAAQTSGLRSPVILRRSEALSVPVAWGWGKQTVVLPPQSDAWDAERAQSVLLHEMAHLHRRDAWTQGIAQAALALHWPNPLTWIAYRRFLNTREQACDDAVLQVGARPTTYASHLVEIARELSPARLSLASVTPLIGPDDLETRIRAILDDGRRRAPASRWALGVTLVLAVLVGGPLAAFQPVARQSPPEMRPTSGASLEGRGLTSTSSESVEAANADADRLNAPSTPAPLARTTWDADQQGDPIVLRDTVDVRRAQQLAREAAAIQRQADGVQRAAAQAERNVHETERQADDVVRAAAEIQRQADEVERASAQTKRQVDETERQAHDVERDAARVRREADDVERGQAGLKRAADGLRRVVDELAREAAQIERRAEEVERVAARNRREARQAEDGAQSGPE